MGDPMQCPSCQNSVQTDWQFCPKCGQTVNSELRFHVLQTAIQLALLGADWKSLCAHLFSAAGVSEQEVANGISLRLKKSATLKPQPLKPHFNKTFPLPERTSQNSGPITAQTVFIPASPGKASGVRDQVFEVIVRQALAGAPWREICKGPMEVNGISELEVQREVNRRREITTDASPVAFAPKKPKISGNWLPGVHTKAKIEIPAQDPELPPQMKRLLSVRDALIRLASSNPSETKTQAELKHMVRQLTVDIDGVLKAFDQPNHATGTGGSQGSTKPPGGPFFNTGDGEENSSA